MPVFEYLAFDAHGRKLTGQIEADSARSARQLLRDKQLLPSDITSVEPKPNKQKHNRAVPNKDIALFTQQFAALVQSNIPLEEALGAVASQTRNKNLKITLQQIRTKVLEGHSIADGMRDHPKVFSPIFRALVQAGEHTGELSQVLLKLADYTQRSQKLRNTVVQATVYPIVLTIVAFSIISLLMAFVVPQVVQQFEGTGQVLPMLTKIMITCSHFIIDYGLWIIGCLLLLAFIWRHLLKNERFALKVHRFMLKLPVIGYLIINLETTRLLGTLSIMLNGGSPLLDALVVSGHTVHNRSIRLTLQDITEKVKAGQLLSKMLTNAKIFPPISVYIVANGEHSGKLAQALEQAAYQQENELNNAIGIATKLIEPILMLVFGILVFAITLAILLPILQMNTLSNF
jgi:general secretion pathway protein F